jgi:hypothetical protein
MVYAQFAPNEVMKIYGAVLNIPLTDHTIQTSFRNLNAGLYKLGQTLPISIQRNSRSSLIC